jgi:hypothetical protein
MACELLPRPVAATNRGRQVSKGPEHEGRQLGLVAAGTDQHACPREVGTSPVRRSASALKSQRFTSARARSLSVGLTCSDERCGSGSVPPSEGRPPPSPSAGSLFRVDADRALLRRADRSEVHGIRALQSPVPEVMKRVFPSGPPKPQLVTSSSARAMKSSFLPSGEMT